MISLDQVYLLEQKVESAVAKIQQLQAENDALRNKCDELTNALSAKSEQLSSFENDQNQIESGIKKALDRLNSIENSVLKAAGQMNSNVQAPNLSTRTVQSDQQLQNVQQPVFTEEPEQKEIEENYTPSFDTMEPSVPFTSEAEDQVQKSAIDDSDSFSFDNSPADDSFEEDTPEEDSTDGLGFDIF